MDPSPAQTCDHCGSPAVVHETLIRNGKTTAVHLCAEHALAAGFPVPAGQPVAEVVLHIVKANQPADPSRPRALASCTGCGVSFAEFRKTGTLGCPACYDSFQPMLGQVIERAQAGGTAHIGRAPRAAAELELRRVRREKLMRELESAVSAEQYERAARLRDELSSIMPGADGTEGRQAQSPSPT
jgi:protein arginine kinase activator